MRNATVVAIGSHGHRRMPGILLGSVATALVHSAPCSVLLARPGETDEFPRSVVVGLDGSAQSREPARHAVAVAARTGATLTGLVAMGGAAIDYGEVRSIVTDSGGFTLTDDTRDPSTRSRTWTRISSCWGAAGCEGSTHSEASASAPHTARDARSW